MNRQSKILLALVILVIVALGFIAVTTQQHKPKQQGSVEVSIAVPDTIGLAATVDGKAINVTGLDLKLVLADGSHGLSITKPGYDSFSTHVTVDTGESLLVNAYLQRHPVPALTSLTNVTPASLTAGWQATSIQYYANKDWAFINASKPGANDVFFVVRYDDASSSWTVALGPTTIANTSATQGFPADLVQYLTDNGYINEGL